MGGPLSPEAVFSPQLPRYHASEGRFQSVVLCLGVFCDGSTESKLELSEVK